ncbi:MAG: hypothetical protein HWE24_21305 [Oceanospirillaceae bacterium]|nr:hypothetical protein [Oceanospirillaceae bacterium]
MGIVLKKIQDSDTEVLITYWNENNSKTKEEKIFSTWDKDSIIEDGDTWLEGNTDWKDEGSGLNNLKEYGGKYDWYELTEILCCGGVKTKINKSSTINVSV